MTADGYVPKVGDRVRHISWASEDYADVTAVGCLNFLSIDERGHEAALPISNAWVLVPKSTPWPELVINVYRHCADILSTEGEAEETAGAARIGKVYVHADGTVTAVRTEATS